MSLNTLPTGSKRPRWRLRCSAPQRNPLALIVALTALAASFGVAAQPASRPAKETPTLEKLERNLRDLGQRARDAAAEISTTALGLVGVDYKFGGNHPDQGLDCSGFVRYVFAQATGITLPRSAREQARVGKTISRDELQPGDLVFFNTRRFQYSHVGVYLGDSRFIHSPSRGGVVEVVDLDNSYWRKTFNGARRVIGAAVAGEASAATLMEQKQIEAAVKKQLAEQAERERLAAEAAEKARSESARAANPSAAFSRDY